MKMFVMTDDTGKQLGKIKGKSAGDVAKWLGGKLAQSAPGWARVEMSRATDMVGGVNGVQVGSVVNLYWN